MGCIWFGLAKYFDIAAKAKGGWESKYDQSMQLGYKVGKELRVSKATQHNASFGTGKTSDE